MISFNDISSNRKKKGKAMRVMHVFNDALSGSVPPNSGFGDSVIYPIESIPQYELSSDEEGVNDEVNTSIPAEDDICYENDAEREGEGDIGLAIGETVPADEDQEADGGAEAVNEVPDPSNSLSPGLAPEAVDALLQTALLRALRYIVKDQQLPMLASALWAIVLR